MRQVLLAPRLRSLANAGDTYFWYAPGRRSQPANCLTWFTGGTGWGMFEMLVKATMYNMPLATAVAYSFADYARLPTTNDVMLYWWVPDPTFLRLAPRRITFPEHDADEWAKGNRRTASRDVSIDKHVSQDLADLAPDVQEFIARLSMSLSSMNDMLLDQLNTKTPTLMSLAGGFGPMNLHGQPGCQRRANASLNLASTASRRSSS